jgi:hypothetical protein
MICPREMRTLLIEGQVPSNSGFNPAVSLWIHGGEEKAKSYKRTREPERGGVSLAFRDRIIFLSFLDLSMIVCV